MFDAAAGRGSRVPKGDSLTQTLRNGTSSKPPVPWRQTGLEEPLGVPWDELSCLFIGFEICAYHHTSMFCRENQSPCSVCEYPCQLTGWQVCTPIMSVQHRFPQNGPAISIRAPTFSINLKYCIYPSNQSVNTPLLLALAQANDRTLATLLTHGRPWSQLRPWEPAQSNEIEKSLILHGCDMMWLI